MLSIMLLELGEFFCGRLYQQVEMTTRSRRLGSSAWPGATAKRACTTLRLINFTPMGQLV